MYSCLHRIFLLKFIYWWITFVFQSASVSLDICINRTAHSVILPLSYCPFWNLRYLDSFPQVFLRKLSRYRLVYFYLICLYTIWWIYLHLFCIILQLLLSLLLLPFSSPVFLLILFPSSSVPHLPPLYRSLNPVRYVRPRHNRLFQQSLRGRPFATL